MKVLRTQWDDDWEAERCLLFPERGVKGRNHNGLVTGVSGTSYLHLTAQNWSSVRCSEGGQAQGLPLTRTAETGEKKRIYVVIHLSLPASLHWLIKCDKMTLICSFYPVDALYLVQRTVITLTDQTQQIHLPRGESLYSPLYCLDGEFIEPWSPNKKIGNSLVANISVF